MVTETILRSLIGSPSSCRLHHAATAADDDGARNGHRFCAIWASNSSRNLLMPDTTGTAQESLSTQIVLAVMLSAMSRSVSRSAWVPCPASMRSMILVVHAVPSRHCVHWAQLSCA